jgi:hypothetical protein
LAGEVFDNDAGGGEGGGEELGLKRAAETGTSASSVLIFFVDRVVSALPEARLRVILVGFAFGTPSFLVSTDWGSRFAPLFGPLSLAFRVLFLEAGARGSWC